MKARRATKIQWTQRTWQVTSGCREWSPGCLNCYARLDARRMGSNPNDKVRRRYQGLVVLQNHHLRWSGEVRELPEQLHVPLHWRAATTVFVNSLSDLFQEGVSFEYIAAVFGVMAMCRQHTFQVLTKRPDRMRAWFTWIAAQAPGNEIAWCVETATETIRGHAEDIDEATRLTDRHVPLLGVEWPLPNVWLGTSVEDQKRADERVPELERVPAVVRFLSCEPLLEAIDLSPWLQPSDDERPPAITWVIVGAESGSEARRCNLRWVLRIVEQCRAGRALPFVKQLGARHVACGGLTWKGLLDPPAPEQEFRFKDRKGGDIEEWPVELRVRELPGGAS